MHKITSIRIAGTDIGQYTILYASDSHPAEINAAKELQRYIYNSTGVLLSLSEDGTPGRENAPEICIGGTNRNEPETFDGQEEAFHIYYKAPRLYIAGGGARGTLYGVYAFLETYLGWRWFAPDTEECVLSGAVEIPADCNLYCRPALEYRDVYWFSAFDTPWAVKMKLNASGDHRKLGPEYGGGIGYGGPRFVHTFSDFMPLSEYFQEHPEYYSLRGGARCGEYLYTQLCLTNPDVLRIITEKILAYMEAHPDTRIISVSQDDSYVGDSYCHCAECEKIHREEGSPMGSLLRFVNAIAETVKIRYPHLSIDTLAYQHTFEPPLHTVPRDNVIIRLCTWNPILSQKHIERRNIREALTRWKAVCNRIYIWDYTTNFSDYLATFPNFANLQPNVRLFADNHVKGIFAQGNYQSVSGEFGELRAYLLARLLWEPEMEPDAYYGHMDAFLEGYYGKGWRYIRNYIDYVQGIVSGSSVSNRGTPTEILPPEQFDLKLAESWWDQAEAMADSPRDRAHIEKSRLQLLHWELFRDGHTDEKDEKAQAFYALLKKHGITHLNEGAAVPVPSCGAEQ